MQDGAGVIRALKKNDTPFLVIVCLVGCLRVASCTNPSLPENWDLVGDTMTSNDAEGLVSLGAKSLEMACVGGRHIHLVSFQWSNSDAEEHRRILEWVTLRWMRPSQVSDGVMQSSLWKFNFTCGCWVGGVAARPTGVTIVRGAVSLSSCCVQRGSGGAWLS